ADPDGYGDVRGVRVVPSYEEAWNAWPEGPAAIVVTSANAHHKDLVLEAARRGVHVLCEKPLATTVADAEEMVAACREAGVVLMTAFPVHFSPAVASLRSALADGALGELIGLTGTNNGKLPTARDWFTDVDLAGGGAMVDHTVHLAEILDSVLGAPATVHATTNRILHADRAGRGPRPAAWSRSPTTRGRWPPSTAPGPCRTTPPPGAGCACRRSAPAGRCRSTPSPSTWAGPGAGCPTAATWTPCCSRPSSMRCGRAGPSTPPARGGCAPPAWSPRPRSPCAPGSRSRSRRSERHRASAQRARSRSSTGARRKGISSPIASDVSVRITPSHPSTSLLTR